MLFADSAGQLGIDQEDDDEDMAEREQDDEVVDGGAHVDEDETMTLRSLVDSDMGEEVEEGEEWPAGEEADDEKLEDLPPALDALPVPTAAGPAPMVGPTMMQPMATPAGIVFQPMVAPIPNKVCTWHWLTSSNTCVHGNALIA